MKIKNLKKILALTVVCVMLAAVLTACGAEHKDWEEIGPNGKMVIGITYYPPMNYLDENGELTGFETEFAKAVCEILEIEAEFIEIDWNAKETELKAKNIDAVWNGMTITPERAEEMDISTPYLRNSQVIVVRAEDGEKYKNPTADDLEGVALVAEAGSTLENVVLNNDLFEKARATYTPIDKQATGLLEVQAGTADMTVIDLIMAEELIKPGTAYEDLTFIEIGLKEEFGIAFRKNSPDTLDKVNGAIRQLLANGKLLEIAEKYDLADSLIK